MNGFEFNKLLAAILVAMLVAMLSGFVASKLVEPEKLEKNAYVVEGVGQPSAETAAAAPAGPAEIKPFLAKADVAAGEKTARVCGTCHSFNKGEPAKIGPNLWGIIGSPHAHMDGFNYSDAMMAKHSDMWTIDDLNQFLFNPRTTMAGTKMTFAGIKNDQDRANVIAWLNTLSDSPKTLPK